MIKQTNRSRLDLELELLELNPGFLVVVISFFMVVLVDGGWVTSPGNLRGWDEELVKPVRNPAKTSRGSFSRAKSNCLGSFRLTSIYIFKGRIKLSVQKNMEMDLWFNNVVFITLSSLFPIRSAFQCKLFTFWNVSDRMFFKPET